MVFDSVGFFTPQRVGLEVEAVNKTIRVVKVVAESSFAKANVKVGDEIVGIDGKPPESLEDFRDRLLNSVLASRARLSLRRNNGDVQVDIRFEVE